MRNITVLVLYLTIIFSCTGAIDNGAGGYQGQDDPDTAPICVFEFTDQRNNSLDVTEVILISNALDTSPITIKSDVPSKSVKIDLKPNVNQIATYHFFVTASNGKTYHAAKDLYIPARRRYEKSIVLVRSEPTLLTDKSSWKVTQVRNGLTWYNFEGFEPISGNNQVINVLEFDLDSEDLRLKYVYYPDRAQISEVAKLNADFIAITNASFGSGFTSGNPVDNTYIRVDGVNHREIGLDPSDSNYGKHESAVWYDGKSEIGFIDMPGDYTKALEYYKQTTYPNLFSSYPMLIKNYERANFSAYKRKVSQTGVDPRTVLAVTYDRKLILMTVDGRWKEKAFGMTLRNVQDFLTTHFYPKYAINMDGGGSTSMFIKGKNVVNYPCEGVSGDNYKVYNGTFKERGLVTYFAITEK